MHRIIGISIYGIRPPKYIVYNVYALAQNTHTSTPNHPLENTLTQSCNAHTLIHNIVFGKVPVLCAKVIVCMLDEQQVSGFYIVILKLLEIVVLLFL